MHQLQCTPWFQSLRVYMHPRRSTAHSPALTASYKHHTMGQNPHAMARLPSCMSQQDRDACKGPQPHTAHGTVAPPQGVRQLWVVGASKYASRASKDKPSPYDSSISPPRPSRPRVDPHCLGLAPLARPNPQYLRAIGNHAGLRVPFRSVHETPPPAGQPKRAKRDQRPN